MTPEDAGILHGKEGRGAYEPRGQRGRRAFELIAVHDIHRALGKVFYELQAQRRSDAESGLVTQIPGNVPAGNPIRGDGPEDYIETYTLDIPANRKLYCHDSK